MTLSRSPPLWRAIVGAIGLHVNAIPANIFLALLYITVRPFSLRAYRWCVTHWVTPAWVASIGCVWPSSEIVFSGDGVAALPDDEAGKPSSRARVLLPNHQLDCDWWYAWMLPLLWGGEGRMKIVSKRELLLAPLIGSGMWLMEYVFLKRKWAEDRPYLARALQGLRALKQFPLWLLIFPEGTTICKESVVKSKSWAERHGRPQLDKVLLPRLTGLEACLDVISDDDPWLYDMTIAYSGYSGEVPADADGYSRQIDRELPSLAKLCGGRAPRAVHINVRRIEASAVRPRLQQWLDECAVRKEKLLLHFAEHGEFPAEETADSRRVFRPRFTYLLNATVWLAAAASVFLLRTAARAAGVW